MNDDSEKNPAGRDRKLELFSILGFGSLGCAALGLVYRGELIAIGRPAIAVQILGIALMVWARATFRARSFHFVANPTEGGLVTTGPYRFIRHPVYAAALVALIPAVVTHATLVPLALGALACLGVSMRIVTEERLVTARYPEYVDYARRTKRLVPFLL